MTLLTSKLSKYFFSKGIWTKITGENYYLTSILDFFQKIDFPKTYFAEQNIKVGMVEEYFDLNFAKELNFELKGALKSPESF